MSDSTEVVHGGLQASELAALGLTPTMVLDLSASLNPRGAHSSVIVAAVEADLRRYPPPHAEPLRDALAARARGATLLTCDAHFAGLPGVTLIEKIKA